MANTVSSPNMNLPVPVVGQEPGPQYATDINSCMSVIDAHNHSAGNGVPINPNGMNINIDLPMNSNNLTTARSVRFAPQGAPIAGVADLGCIYESGVDLWYNDGSGNQVRITASGGLAGTPGSIANLTPPASATYVAGDETFVWQSAANTAANLDAGSLILRNITSGSFGLTLSPPTLGSNYTIVLPTLPGSTALLDIDSAGNMGTVTIGSGLTFSGGTLSIAPGSVTRAELTPRGIGSALGNVAISPGFSGAVAGVGPIATLTTTISTNGGPVCIGFIVTPGVTATPGSPNGAIQLSGGTTTVVILFQNTTLSSNIHSYNPVGAGVSFMAAGFSGIDTSVVGIPGTYTYNIFFDGTGGTTATFSNISLMTYEM